MTERPVLWWGFLKKCRIVFCPRPENSCLAKLQCIHCGKRTNVLYEVEEGEQPNAVKLLSGAIGALCSC